jgi:hypothetical protein
VREVTKTLLLGKGLRTDWRLRRNSDQLTELFNAEVTKNGVTKIVPVTAAFSDEVISAASAEINWPFPQIIRGKRYTFLANKNRLDIAIEADWSLAEVDTYNAHDKNALKGIATGNAWQLVDFGETWLLTNGVATVFRSGLDTLLGAPDRVYVQDSIPINAGCAFRGRAFFGGFDPDNFWSDHWKRFLADWATRAEVGLSVDKPFDKNFVWWSTVGGGDMLWLVYPEIYMSGHLSVGFTNERPLIFDYWSRNESGFIPMPWRGYVFNLQSYGEGVMVYGEDGVSYLKHSANNSTFGLVEIFNHIGIASRSAAGGNDRNQLFVDSTGMLWLAVDGKGPEKLGYQEFFEPLLGTEIVVSYSEQDNVFYISGEDATYRLSRYGLSRIDQAITSVLVAGGETKGVCTDLGENDSEIKIASDVLDFGIRGQKTITQVEIPVQLDHDAGENYYVSIYYRYEKNKDFAQTEWRPVNKEGWVRFYVSAVEFKIGIKCTSFEEADVPESITAHIAYADKRGISGQNVSETVTRIGE